MSLFTFHATPKASRNATRHSVETKVWDATPDLPTGQISIFAKHEVVFTVPEFVVWVCRALQESTVHPECMTLIERVAAIQDRQTTATV